MTVAFPLSPTPPYYAHCSFPNRNGVFYAGETPAILLSQNTPDHYQVRDYLGNLIVEDDISFLVPAPPLGASNDLALASIAWFEPTATPDSSPAFSPGATGTNHFADSTVLDHWKISSQSLQLNNAVARTFSTSFDVACAWSATLAFIKSAIGQTAAVVQYVPGIAVSGSPAHCTATIPATSTNNLLFVQIHCDSHITSVVDNAGNTWVQVSHMDGQDAFLASSYIFCTKVAHPLSITSLTVTCDGAGPLINFGFYEVSGANNTDPIDAVPDDSNTFGVGWGYGNSAIISLGIPTGAVDLASPPGGWPNGWFRVYFTGPNTDALFGNAYGATNFLMVRNDPRFKPMPAPSVTDSGNDGAPLDIIMKGVLGLGTVRFEYQDTSNVGSELTRMINNIALSKAYWSASGYTDPVRPRPLMVSFGNGVADVFSLSAGPSNPHAYHVYCKDETIDGSKVFVQISPGSVSNMKLQVFFPNASTLVETFDNITEAQLTSRVSAYIVIHVFQSGLPINQGPTAIGNVFFTSIQTIVSALTPDVKHWEGPSNEPRIDATNGPREAHEMRLFSAAVKAIQPDAVMMGPGVVSTNYFTDPNNTFFNVNHGYCDAVSFHDYNSMTNGDLNLARADLDAFHTWLVGAGLGAFELWQTEAGAQFNSIYGVYHPRRARQCILHQLIWEQYGIPREQNPGGTWYDVSHGFWGVPAFIEHADSSLNPQACLFRVLAEETFGQLHTERLNFGELGERIFLGSRYQAPGGASTLVLMATSFMPGASMTFTIAGTTSPLVFVDAFGNQSTRSIVDGRVTVPVSDVPVYLRLPVGVTATVYTCNDWPPVGINGQGHSASPLAAGKVSGVVQTILGDGRFITDYGSQIGIIKSTHSLPDTAELRFPSAVRVDRVVVWAGSVWQADSTLLDFDVQTSVDGTTWVTQTSFLNTSATSFVHGSDFLNAGCQRETYFNEQWVFDLPFPTPVECVAVRLYVRDASHGGEPDAACVVANGQGLDPGIVIQEMAVLCDANTRPAYAVIP